MPKENSITVVVPALNEENHLAGAVAGIVQATEQSFDEYEILVFNDGSTDRTGEIAEELAERYEYVRAFHHKSPKCIGGVIREGLKRAKMNYFIYVDGKGATSAEALAIIFAEKGKADLVISYATNVNERNIGRRIISRLFQTLLNILFRLNVKHYGNSILYRSSQLKQFNIRTNSFGYQPEALIKMLKSGCSYVQAGYKDKFDIKSRKSKAFKLTNIINVSKFILATLWEIYIRKDTVKMSNIQDAAQTGVK